MTRRPVTLTAAFVRTVSKPGVYGDGRGSRGLSLRVHRMKSGRLSRTWRQRLRVAGRLTDDRARPVSRSLVGGSPAQGH